MGSLYSADIALLMKIAELANRYGLRPSEANARVDYLRGDKDGKEHYHHELSFRESMPHSTSMDKHAAMMAALGCDEHDVLKVEHLSDLEDIVDRALSLAPRARTR